MRAEVLKRRLCRKAPLHEIRRDAGDENLTAVSNREQARDAIDGRAEIIAPAFLSGSGVHGHAHRQAVDQ